MAKELPYFRFTAAEWLNGDISLTDYAMQGLFANICAFYWFKDCSLTQAKLKQKYSNAQEMIQKLIDEDIIKVDESTDFIRIDFLDEQFDMLSDLRKRRQEAGSKGGKNRASKAQAMLKQSSSYKDKDNNKEKDKDKEKEIYSDFEKFLDKYPGTKRGYDVEFTNFQKKNKDWKEIMPTLLTELNRQIKEREKKHQAGKFVPEWKNLQTYINNRAWEEVFYQKEKLVINTM